MMSLLMLSWKKREYILVEYTCDISDGYVSEKL